ncbi:hypothetical protein [Candidatus Thioglobus sp.]
MEVSGDIVALIIAYFGLMLMKYNGAFDFIFGKPKKLIIITNVARGFILLFLFTYINSFYKNYDEDKYKNTVLIPNIKESLYEFEMHKKSICNFNLKRSQKIKRLTEKSAVFATRINNEDIVFEKISCTEAQDE